MWASQYWNFNEPYTWVNSGGLGTMGFSIPAAIGAKVGRPDRTVWAVDGDGCFQMTAQELVTAIRRADPDQGRPAQQQLPRHGAPVAGDVLRRALQRGLPLAGLPGLRELGRGDGLRRIRVEAPEEVEPAIEKANSINDRPVVVEFRVDSDEKVFPMVPAGQSNDDIVLPASNRTDWVRCDERRDQPPHPVGARAEPAGVLARVASLFARRGSTSSRSRSPRPRTRG